MFLIGLSYGHWITFKLGQKIASKFGGFHNKKKRGKCTCDESLDGEVRLKIKNL